jgi:hypothetical protein
MMLRFVEILFFLAPFALYAGWRMLGARAARWLPWAALACLAVLAGLVLVWRDIGAEGPKAIYVPAHLQGGDVVPGHAR